MKTSNPVLKDSMLSQHKAANTTAHMTINGTIVKTAFLFVLLSCAAFFVKERFVPENILQLQTMVTISFVITALVGLMTYFKPQWSAVTAPIYALSEGILIGYLSMVAEVLVPGIVTQAILLSFSVLFALLLLYGSGVLRINKRMQGMIMGGMMAVFMVYMATYVLSFFRIKIPYIHESGLLGIGFSVFVVVLCSLSLVLDFQYIVAGEEGKAPKYMEWYCAYGLMVTLVWLYVEILSLLMKLSKRKD